VKIAVFVIAFAVLCVAPFVFFCNSVKRIEKRLDESHDHFRYFDRHLSSSIGGNSTLAWLKDFLHRYRPLGYNDPVLHRLVLRHQAIRTAQIICGVIWLVFSFFWLSRPS